MTGHNGLPQTPEELERSLIASARLDMRPAPDAVRHRILVALSAAGAIGTGSTIVGATSGVVARLAIVKWIAASALVVGAGAGTYAATHRGASIVHLLTPARAVDHASEGASPASPQAADPASPAPLLAPAPNALTSIPQTGQPQTTSSPRTASRHRSSTSKPQPTIDNAESPEATSLEGEVALLDRARAALAAGNASRTLALLDEYQQTFAKGGLRPEATYLRIQALSKSGQRVAARDLASRFLAEHPDSPHASQLQALLAQ